VRWDVVIPSEDLHVADWIRERLHGWAVDVGSVIPEGFAAYARIFHPAWRAHMVEWRWSDVAAANGRIVHPEMQFHSIAAPPSGHAAAGAEWYGPREGTLSPGQLQALIPLLAALTSTPERCWLCVWDGYGYFNPGAIASLAFTAWPDGGPPPPPPPPPPRPKVPHGRVRLPARDYLLFTGPVTAAGPSNDPDHFAMDDGPNLWWPHDRAWCVASEIDFPYTYVAGSEPLIAEILANPGLEALPATIHDRITADGDMVNT
jgi:hypothetical protein